jgi:sarcosine oxidase
VAAGDAASAIVVGAGVWGAAIAAELVARGWTITLVEQWSPANARGSSGDRTRMARIGHASNDEAADLWYARSALASLARWSEIEAEEGTQLLHATRLVWLARGDDGPERVAAERLRAVGLEPEIVPPERLGELFPSITTDDLAYGLLEPTAAIVRATAAVEVLVERARRGGARLLRGRAHPVDQPVSVRVDDGILAADRVVWACGSWLGRLFPEEAPIVATWQDVLHWQSPPEWHDAAAWFDEHEELYGFPDVEGLGVKAVTDHRGRPLDPDVAARHVDPAAVGAVAGYLARRFPGLAGAPLLWGRVMHYEMTPDANFLIGFRPGDERSLLAGGGSGHGFKHAPTIGQHVADLLESRAEPVPLFAPGRRRPGAASR